MASCSFIMKTLLVGNSDCTCLLIENLLITREIKRSNGQELAHMQKERIKGTPFACNC